MRRWLARKLSAWSIRLHEDWHTVTVVDGDGATVFTFGCYGQWCASWRKPYDMTCSCEAES